MSSLLNPDAPNFVPAAFRNTEDFSQEWWDKVQNSPAFRDYWLRERFASLEAEVTESGNSNEEEELVDEQLLEDMVDEELKEELYVLDIDEDFDEVLQDSSAELCEELLDGRQS
ncbi:hypothetical protein CLOM_g18971 [Closterium sp. NIES-68]|nr:hypothetical protein CLOM_g18971 [Closterium sp. NIES-68]GJP66195.1 hypothetical protein CLOP_g23097 [Closterium sp. NIES-67]GJP78907.1 hypothetical protein CLOP_g9171 [Closterium sp. NIES-67]